MYKYTKNNKDLIDFIAKDNQTLGRQEILGKISNLRRNFPYFFQLVEFGFECQQDKNIQEILNGKKCNKIKAKILNIEIAKYFNLNYATMIRWSDAKRNIYKDAMIMDFIKQGKVTIADFHKIQNGTLRDEIFRKKRLKKT